MSGIIAQNSGRHTGLVKAASAGGEWTLIQTLTSDGSDASLSFTSGIDSTYDEYCFKFINIHAETDDATFKFNGSDDTSSHSYDITKTTSFFDAYHNEGGSLQALGYRVAEDIAQGTGVTTVMRNLGNDADAGSSGYLYLFAPSSTTFVKHFISAGSIASSGTYHVQNYMAGYFNTTAAITAIQFSMSSGEIQGGSISLFGIG